MAIDILVPPLSQTMDTLVFVAWSKKVGDPVTKGETLYQVETDKATLEVESPATGILQEVLAEPGAEVPVRSKIGVIIAPGEVRVSSVLPDGPQTKSGALSDDSLKPVEIPHPESGLPVSSNFSRPNYSGPGADRLPPERLSRIFASPRARNLAKIKGISIEDIKGSGPQGLIIERDISAVRVEKTGATRVTPLAKKLAETSGVNLNLLTQAHPGSVIRRSDIEAAMVKPAEEHVQVPAASQQPVRPVAPPALPGKGRPVALTSLRKTIARRMLESHQTTAAVTLTREVDVTGLVSLRTSILKELAESDPRPTYTDFLVLILCKTLLRHPNLNATFNGESLEEYESVHMAIAVDTDRGLLVPVIHSANQKGLLELAGERLRLAHRAQEGTLTPDELSGGTFTITNLGTLGVDGFTPILFAPQVGILGLGRIRSIPAVFEGQVSIRSMMMLSLTFDHRVVDGAPAARFLQEVTRLVENPQLLWL
jgi:pyruvate dehydrogenase E2 component (dihydrolipoamide acetyltransferase)